jgi:hypothetical protein
MPGTASDFFSAERAFLLHLQALAIRYILDNQTADGLFLDRQRNLESRQAGEWPSIAATGMGLIAVALASAEPLSASNPD